MSAKLYYTNGRGLAEVIRIALGAAEIEFEESFMETKEDLAKVKSDGNSLFGQTPLLEIDGLHLTQSMAIVRYICRKQGWIEMLSDGARDMYLLFIAAAFEEVSSNKTKAWSDALQKAKDRYLPVFEKELETTGSGYLVGDSLTMCDLVFLDCITWIAESDTEMLEDYPNILNFLMTVTSQPVISKFLSGPQRKPEPTSEYIKKVIALFELQ